jgi:septum site-determining protein MinD
VTAATLAFVGAAGGVGTTRLTLECGTLLARNGEDVAILDAAYATQGLADRTAGKITPDMTALCLDDAPLEDGLSDRDVDGAGRLAVCPARAPFERVATAKTPEAARSFAERIDEAARRFDRVLVDTPPVAANQAVAAATGVDRVAIVCDAARAAEAVPRTADRLSDVGVETTSTVVTVVTRTEDHPDADATVPAFDADLPAVAAGSDGLEAVAEVVETVCGIGIETTDEADLRERLPI